MKLYINMCDGNEEEQYLMVSTSESWCQLQTSAGSERIPLGTAEMK